MELMQRAVPQGAALLRRLREPQPTRVHQGPLRETTDGTNIPELANVQWDHGLDCFVAEPPRSDERSGYANGGMGTCN